MGALYHLLIVVAGISGILFGFRKGLLRQTAGLLGIALGIVADRIFHSSVAEILSTAWGAGADGICGRFLVSVISTLLVFSVFYFSMVFLGKAVGRILSVIGGGLLDSIAGALSGLFQAILLLSFCYNVVIGMDENSCLLKYGTDDDGNLAEGVLLLAPALFDCESYTDLARRVQLREAKKISDNNMRPADVKQEEAENVSGIIYRYA